MEIQKIQFGPKKYLVVKKAISTDQITDTSMYDKGFKHVAGYLGEHGLKPAGALSVLYFLWDEKYQKAEIGMGFPVKDIDYVSDPELSLVDVPASKALMSELHGSYKNLGMVHDELRKNLQENKLDYADMAIEEYVVDPSMTSNQTELVTDVYYLYR